MKMIVLKRAFGVRNSTHLLQNIRFKMMAANSINTLKESNSAKPTYTIPFSSNSTLELRNEAAEFMKVFPDVVRDLTDFASTQIKLKDAAEHFTKALNYNVPDGKKIRGLTTVIVYKELLGKEKHTPENIRNAHLLGWCVELLQAVFLMSDDIIDNSDIRRDKPCWYRLNDVQSIAINDILMIENGCYYILKRAFGHLPCYPNMFELLHKTAMNTFIGQSLDLHMSKADVIEFSMEKHRCISNYKTSFFAFYTPIALPIILAGYENRKLLDDIKSICCEIGHFYQTQNDFLDCFSEADVLKKPGTDIEDGKCTWLAAMSMELGTEQHKNIMKEFYGKNDIECIEKIKQVYNDLNLPDVYNCYEENTYNSIKQQIKQLSQSNNLIHNILLNTLNRTFNRV